MSIAQILLMPIILIRKNKVVKRRAGCFQKVDNVRLNVLAQEGYALTKDELAALSPYQTQHVKRFGYYELDLQTIPQPITDDLLFEIVLPNNPLPALLDIEATTPE
jgi:hypothetical protein